MSDPLRDAREPTAKGLESRRAWHRQFTAKNLPWRVMVDGGIVALFMDQRDAVGFAKARYGTRAVVELRKRGRSSESGL